MENKKPSREKRLMVASIHFNQLLAVTSNIDVDLLIEDLESKKPVDKYSLSTFKAVKHLKNRFKEISGEIRQNKKKIELN